MTEAIAKEQSKNKESQSQVKEILQERLDLYKVEIDENELNLRRNIILGGVFYFDMLQIPPQPKRIANWIAYISPFNELYRLGHQGASKSISNKKQVSYLYKATADVKIALGIKVLVKDSLMFFCIWSPKSYQANRKIIAKP